MTQPPKPTFEDECETFARKYADDRCTLNCHSPVWQAHYTHAKFGYAEGKREALASELMLKTVRALEDHWCEPGVPCNFCKLIDLWEEEKKKGGGS